MKTKYSLAQLDAALQNDLKMCETRNEMLNCQAIGGREIKERASEIRRERQFTTNEEIIAYKYGWHPRML